MTLLWFFKINFNVFVSSIITSSILFFLGGGLKKIVYAFAICVADAMFQSGVSKQHSGHETDN